MKYILSFILFLAAGALIAYDQYNLEYWMTPPEKRAETKWKSESKKPLKFQRNCKLQSTL